jgi:hypothetical protein
MSCRSADEFGVNRKTVRRRLDALERADREEAERIANTRLRRQIAAQQRTLTQRDEQVASSTVEVAASRLPRKRRSRMPDYYNWLDKRKNLAGRAFAEARGLVWIQTPDGKNRRWVERADLDGMFEDGWILVPD